MGLISRVSSRTYREKSESTTLFFIFIQVKSRYLYIANMSTVNLQPSQRFWPEFTVPDLLSENWGAPQVDGKKKGAPQTPDGERSSESGYLDNDPMSRILPDGLKAEKWVKASEYLSKIQEKTEHTELSMFYQPTQSQTEIEEKTLENNDHDFLTKNSLL